MPTGVYVRAKAQCGQAGCSRLVTSGLSKSGLCRYHATRQWKRENAAAVNGHNRRYNAAKPGVMARSRARWRVAHPESAADRQAVRRARKRGLFVEKVYRSRVFRRDRGICGICGQAVDPADWHLDHVVPFARGGEHSYANTQVSHPACNLTKAAK